MPCARRAPAEPRQRAFAGTLRAQIRLLLVNAPDPRMPPLPPITQALLLANVAMFCLDFFVGDWLIRLLALWPIGGGFLPWQVVTYSFLHGSLGHLFFNMLGLWMFGSELERVWGQRRYLQFYFASVLAAAATQLLVGASTGVDLPDRRRLGRPVRPAAGFGMMFPNRMIVPLIPPIPMKAKVFVAIYGGLELLLGVTGSRSRGSPTSRTSAACSAAI